MSERLIAAVNGVLAESPGAPWRPELTGVHLALVREAVGLLGWATADYACEACGFRWTVWLSLGVEGPAGLRAHGLYVASPFCSGRCYAWPLAEGDGPAWERMRACDGEMRHVAFASDRTFAPVLIPDDAPRFVLSSCHGSAELVVPDPALVAARRFHEEDGAA